MYEFVPKAVFSQFVSGIVAAGLVGPQEVHQLQIEAHSDLQRSAVCRIDGVVTQALSFCPSFLDPKRYKARLAALRLKDAVFVDMLRGGADIIRIAAAQAYIKEMPLIITDLTL